MAGFFGAIRIKTDLLIPIWGAASPAAGKKGARD
jgi:hypothetical protein